MDPSDWRQPLVRQLAWTLAGPSLLDGQGRHGHGAVADDWCQRCYVRLLSWFTDCDADPTPIVTALEDAASHRLGHRFEALVACWLRRLTGGRVLLNQPVRVGRRVLGECDLLWHDGQGWWHWECAVKFYLQGGAAGDLRAWRGPDPSDSLVDKLDDLFGRQLQWTMDPRAATMLLQAGVRGAVRTAGLVKGWLFFAGSDWATTPAPAACSPDLARGWWCHRRDAASMPQRGRDSRYVVVGKEDWLGPLRRPRGDGQPRAACARALQRRPAHHTHLVIELRPSLSGDLAEHSRGFVVPDGWPG